MLGLDPFETGQMVSNMTGMSLDQMPTSQAAVYALAHGNTETLSGYEFDEYFSAMNGIGMIGSAALVPEAAPAELSCSISPTMTSLLNNERLLDFATSMFPGPPAMSGAGAVGAATGYIFSPEEAFR